MVAVEENWYLGDSMIENSDRMLTLNMHTDKWNLVYY